MDLSSFGSCFPKIELPRLWSYPIRHSSNPASASAATMASSKQSSDNAAQDSIHTPTQEQPDDQLQPAVIEEMDITSSLKDLQTNEQRRVLDTVAQVRKCGLESILSLPQLVVCGDQSAGKSSVLEALTEIPFPRNDNLCTRFATEIILRRANTNSLTIKIIPDPKRPTEEQTPFKIFKESITNFGELPRIMNAAMDIMDIGAGASGPKSKAFARDVLSIEIEGPSRPQLTLVDIPGLIQTDTKGITKADVELVGEITDHYIKQPRTICLAVVSAASDHANQSILTKVRAVDPEGNRTLGIITKPDRLDSGSGSETAFIVLAQNQDIHFKLGWHVLKNRKFDERDFSLMERSASEDTYFRTSNFKCLPDDCVGIDALRTRLSKLLFEHVRQELPKLRSDLEEALTAASKQLSVMGERRSTSADCRKLLTQLSLAYWESCKAAVDGHYEGEYFNSDSDSDLSFSLDLPSTIRRMRAVIQSMNGKFSDDVRVKGHKYQIDMSGNADATDSNLLLRRLKILNPREMLIASKPRLPINLDRGEALGWVRLVLVRNRGRELVGNFNPLLIGELFWEQCSKWYSLALEYLDQVNEVCSRFLELLLKDKCPKDIIARLHASLVQDALKIRYDNAFQELKRIIEDTRSYPINYNHYYTDTIHKSRQARNKTLLTSCIKEATTHEGHNCSKDHTTASVNVDKAVDDYSKGIDPDMENVCCEEALDCLFAIYKVSRLGRVYL